MKKFTYAFILMIGFNQIIAQQFSFDIYLYDGYGNSDTITIGYDVNATDSIDQLFGEVNIINKPWDSVFEARISPLSQYAGPINNYLPIYQSKKQILKYNPQSPYNPWSAQYSNPVFIEVYSSMGRPFSLHWNKMLFADSSRMHSGFFFINGINLPRYVVDSDSLIFYDWYSENSYYLKNNDTIWLLGFSFFSYSEVGIKDNFPRQEDHVSVYPNPATKQITLDLGSQNQMIETLNIFTITGQKAVGLINVNSSNTIDIHSLKSGVYLLEGVLESGESFVGKFVKE